MLHETTDQEFHLIDECKDLLLRIIVLLLLGVGLHQQQCQPLHNLDEFVEEDTLELAVLLLVAEIRSNRT